MAERDVRESFHTFSSNCFALERHWAAAVCGRRLGLRETTHIWQMRMWPWLKLPRTPVWETSQSLPKKRKSLFWCDPCAHPTLPPTPPLSAACSLWFCRPSGQKNAQSKHKRPLSAHFLVPLVAHRQIWPKACHLLLSGDTPFHKSSMHKFLNDRATERRYSRFSTTEFKTGAPREKKTQAPNFPLLSSSRTPRRRESQLQW